MKDVLSPKPYVFVLMPFSSDFDDIYELGIRAACDNAGSYCERVDEQIFEETILERIYNQISKADLIIADMSGRNPNVFYEVGYAHALGKRVILLTQNAEDIPFDLKHYPHIVYCGRIGDLKNNLYKRVVWASHNPLSAASYFSGDLTFRVNTIALLDDPLVQSRINPGTLPASTVLDIDAHNSMEKRIESIQFKLGLLVPLELISLQTDSGQITKFDRLSDGQILYIIESDFNMLPGEWKKIRISLEFKGSGEIPQSKMALRAFRESGTEDYKFTLKLEY